MEEDNCADNSQKARLVLGDVTNQLGKRAFSVFSAGQEEGFGIKEKNSGKSILVMENEGVKKVCLPRVFSKLKEQKKNDFGQDEVKDDLGTNPVILDFTKNEAFLRNNPHGQDGGKLKEIGFPMVSNGSMDNVEPIVEVSSGADDTGTSDETGDNSGEYCEILEHDEAPTNDYGDKQKNLDTDHEVVISLENAHSEIDLLQDEGERHGVDDLVQSQTGSVDHNRLPLSQESRCFGLERCTTLKGGDCSNTNATIEMIKTCTCSFCTKAAYIWTDLHYQDYKARVATIKKSEKEASLLAERSSRSMETEKHGNTPQNSTGVSNLESKLMGQWRSLFSQMEKMYELEGTHLEASLVSLKDLREKCKVDLEFLNRPDS
ncbi:hypothetical protein LIER_24170 [Lithospermum erythrorhizon]|uniref:Uncharacterized protein n=1 Tax=Lithospermum erythrorhizon TaxID=34254 RepID=A0AAV3R031_LITER